MVFDAIDAVNALEEFRGMPCHIDAVNHVASAARRMDGTHLRAEVRRVKRAFNDYRADVAFMGELY